MPYDTINHIPDDEFIEGVKNSISRSDFFRKFQMPPRGAKYKTFNKRVKRMGIDISHFCRPHDITKENLKLTVEQSLERHFVENSKTQSGSLKKYILRGNLIEYKCAKCANQGEHLGLPLALQLDHINGIHSDNRLENLRFLCPNCHSQTETFSGRNLKDKPQNLKAAANKICPNCGCKKYSTSKVCYDCRILPTKIIWPPLEELLLLVERLPMTTIAKQLGVSDNAIRKHIEAAKKRDRSGSN